MAGKNTDIHFSTKHQRPTSDNDYNETTIPTIMLSLTDVTALSDSLAYIIKKVSEYIADKKNLLLSPCHQFQKEGFCDDLQAHDRNQ